MEDTEPCKICGSRGLNLVDGFYYCVECGTQDATVRETLVENAINADGIFLLTTKRSIRKKIEEIEEMTGEWYKWHAYNFILVGLADELIAIGARPTFKTKLLWLWTKYVKKYQDKSELDLGQKKENKDGNENCSENEEEEENDETLHKSSKIKFKMSADLSKVKKGVLLGLIYVALNLDYSEIHLSDLLRFIREDKLNLKRCEKFLPDEINIASIPQWETFRHSSTTWRNMPIFILSVFQQLNVVPVLPDLRVLVDKYLKELCIPNDFKNLVHSIMNLLPYKNFLDMDIKTIRSLPRMPSYEYTAMAYILIAFKMCFGLDDDYEIRLSNAVDRINNENCYLKSYKLSGSSEPTDRLFSFREWCNFIQFRKIILCKYYFHMSEHFMMDVDDYIYMEQSAGRIKVNEPSLSDEILMNMLQKIPQMNITEVIPKTEFKATLTPMTSYTEVVLQYLDDPDLRLLLSEDFTQYSLKYALEKLQLFDKNDDKNIILGVDDTNKVINKSIYGRLEINKHDSTMVYVRNCDNKNWLKTNPPTVKHIKKVSDNTSNDSKMDINLEDENNDCQESIDIKNEFECIEEEKPNINVFDDSFEDVYDETKVEIDEPEISDVNDTYNNDTHFEHTLDNNVADNNSEQSFDELDVCYNPDTFDRQRTIKDFIIATCQKFKIKVPREYDTSQQKTEKRKLVNDMAGDSSIKKRRLENLNKQKHAKRGEVKQQVNSLISEYWKRLQNDVIFQVAEQVKAAVVEANQYPENVCESIEENVNDTQNDHVAFDDDNNHEPDEVVSISSKDSDSSVNIVENAEQTKTNPRFNEKEYNIKQLYVKVDDGSESEDEDVFDIADDPEIAAIIDKKNNEIGEDEKEVVTTNEHEAERSDSDDDIPLSDLKKEKLAIMQSNENNVYLRSLIKNKANIQEFKYWARHYTYIKRLEYNAPFQIELFENYPKGFNFIIRHCAEVIDCLPFNIYRAMETLEKKMFCHLK